MKESLDVFFNGVFKGTIEAEEQATAPEVAKAAEVYFPRRTVTIKKYINIPHRSIAFIEKVA